MTLFKKIEAKKIETNKARELSPAEMLRISGGAAGDVTYNGPFKCVESTSGALSCARYK